MKLWPYIYNLGAFVLKGFKAKSVREFYDSAAVNYDNAMAMQDYLVSIIIGRMPECDTALDLGLGTGITSGQMRKKCNTLVSVDFSDGMINEGKKRLGIEAKILKCNFLELPLADNSIEVAASTGAVRHIPAASYGKFFSEVYRVVNGCFITEARDFTFFEKAYYRAYGKLMDLLGHSEQPLNSDKGRLEKALADSGFEAKFEKIKPNSRNYIAIAQKEPIQTKLEIELTYS